MSIEAMLKSNNELLERIAVSLEAIVESQGIVAGTIKPRQESQQQLPLDDDLGEEEELEDDDDLGETEDDDLDDDDLDDDPKPVAKKKKVGKKKKKAKKKSVGKKVVAESDYTADEVRGFLKDVQIATGSAAQAKSILKKNGASTFGQLQVGRYNETVAACKVILDEYE